MTGTTPPLGDPPLVWNRAMHHSLGAEQEITKQVEVSVEGFYEQLDSLSPSDRYLSALSTR